MGRVIKDLEEKCHNQEDVDMGKFVSKLPGKVKTFLVDEGLLSKY